LRGGGGEKKPRRVISKEKKSGGERTPRVFSKKTNLGDSGGKPEIKLCSIPSEKVRAIGTPIKKKPEMLRKRKGS